MCESAKFFIVSENGKFQEYKKPSDVIIISPSKKMAEKIIKIFYQPVEITGKGLKIFVTGKKYKWQIRVKNCQHILEFYGQIESINNDQLTVDVVDKKSQQKIKSLQVIIKPEENRYNVNFIKI